MKLTDYVHTSQRESRDERERQTLRALLEKIASSYSDDPGTSDLYDEQPVTANLTLGDVRFARQFVR